MASTQFNLYVSVTLAVKGVKLITKVLLVTLWLILVMPFLWVAVVFNSFSILGPVQRDAFTIYQTFATSPLFPAFIREFLALPKVMALRERPGDQQKANIITVLQSLQERNNGSESESESMSSQVNNDWSDTTRQLGFAREVVQPFLQKATEFTNFGGSLEDQRKLMALRQLNRSVGARISASRNRLQADSLSP